MLVITLTTLPISAEDSPSLATVAVVVAAASTAFAATALASAAFDAISRIEAPICSAPAATVCTFRETSSAAEATTPDWALVSPAEAEICADDADSSSDDAATASADAAISATVRRHVRRGDVQRLGHLPELVTAAHRQADRQVAGGQSLEPAAHVADSAHDPARHHEGHEQPQHQDERGHDARPPGW